MRLRERQPYQFTYPTYRLVNEWLAQGNGEIRYRPKGMSMIFDTPITCMPIPYTAGYDNDNVNDVYDKIECRYWGDTLWQSLDYAEMCADLGYPDEKMWKLHEQLNNIPKETDTFSVDNHVDSLNDIHVNRMVDEIRNSFNEALAKSTLETENSAELANKAINQIHDRLHDAGIYGNVYVSKVSKDDDGVLVIRLSSDDPDTIEMLKQLDGAVEVQNV